jgi:hypothetical protein
MTNAIGAWRQPSQTLGEARFMSVPIVKTPTSTQVPGSGRVCIEGGTGLTLRV